MSRGLRPAALAALALVMALALASCQQSRTPPTPNPPTPKAAPVVEVTMRDYRYDFDPPSRAGHVVFRFVNAGKVIHRPAMVALPDDVPPIAEQLRGTERRFLDPLTGIYDRRPGRTGTFAMNLRQNQRYAIICFAIDRDETPHRNKGMAVEFRTEAPPKPI